MGSMQGIDSYQSVSTVVERSIDGDDMLQSPPLLCTN